ncbi:hypothetical protein [Rhizobium rhizogenes]|uniref:Uncharacterized protein n=1 Tax=Rhizobium rhizogenes (strain K84 / ATCC BAA-868) TaxID=311403 RepID=B9JF20_RHIR8|nr:hypothetical protein Arad_2288 [Rhizobium rhizogenes K84]
MRVSKEVEGPSLVDVLAFTMIENTDDVARVERSAAERMAAVRGWYGWRVQSVDIAEDTDELVRLTVNAEPVGAGYRPDPVKYEFLVGSNNRRRSARFDAFLHACGIIGQIDEDRELVGRYFSTRNRGRTAGDFGSLINALSA